MKVRIGNKEIKSPLFVDNIIVYIENPKESTNYRNNKRLQKYFGCKMIWRGPCNFVIPVITNWNFKK